MSDYLVEALRPLAPVSEVLAAIKDLPDTKEFFLTGDGWDIGPVTAGNLRTLAAALARYEAERAASVPSTDEVEAIRARHEATEAEWVAPDRPGWRWMVGEMAHTDRATLLRLQTLAQDEATLEMVALAMLASDKIEGFKPASLEDYKVAARAALSALANQEPTT